MPIPGTPGTLSLLSPASDWTSTTLFGNTPNFSKTFVSSIQTCFIGSNITVLLSTNCIKSLSLETIIAFLFEADANFE